MSIIYKFNDNSLFYHHSIDNNPCPEDFKMHAHEMCEVLCVISGNCRYLVEGSEYIIEPGSIMLMRPGETHKLKLMADSPYERIAVHFTTDVVSKIDSQGRLLEAFVNRPLGQYNLYRRSSFRSAFVYDCLNAMKTDSNEKYFERLAVTSHLYPLLYEIRSTFYAMSKEANTYQDISREIVEYVNCNLMSGDLSLELISQRFLLSKNQLNRLFKQATGTTVWQYVIIKRMMEARKMLRAGRPASEVCLACGFKDYSAFYRLYKKRFNTIPQNDHLKL